MIDRQSIKKHEFDRDEVLANCEADERKDMLTLIVTTTVMAVLYGLAWHNQPAKQPALTRRAKSGSQS